MAVDPSITVTVTGSVVTRGAPTTTGRVFLAYASATALTGTPVLCTSAAQATAAGAPAPIATYVSWLLALGAPDVVLINCTASNYSAVTQAEWEAGFATAGKAFGPGDCIIPGVTTAAAYAALNTQATSTNRCAFLDTAPTGNVAATLASTAAGLTGGSGATKMGIFTPSVNVPAAGGSTTVLPGSVVAAGLAAAADSLFGHAGHAVEWSFGIIQQALASGPLTQVYTDADRQTMESAGINVIRQIAELGNAVAINTWNTLAISDPVFTKIGYSRVIMQITQLLANAGAQFVGSPIDKQGVLWSRVKGACMGVVAPILAAGGITSYAVTCDGSNNAQSDITAGRVNVQIALTLPGVAETITITIPVSIG